MLYSVLPITLLMLRVYYEYYEDVVNFDLIILFMTIPGASKSQRDNAAFTYKCFLEVFFEKKKVERTKNEFQNILSSFP